jgi:Transglycosylase SLT domain
MPGTAEWRGLLDRRDPIQSLHKSADYLRELRKTFGNLGLAAAAYNGGSGRVEAWLSGQGGLPRETRRYVEIVTGLSVDHWRAKNEGEATETQSMPAQIPCPFAADNGGEAMRRQNALRSTAAVSGERSGHLPAGGWSVQIAANYIIDKAYAQLERLEEKFKSILGARKAITVSRRVAGRGRAPMTRVIIVENSKADAVALCARLRAVGAPCVVTRNL